MAMTATTGDSVRIGTSAAFQVTVTVVTGTGKSISDTFNYDGSLADITSQVKQRIAQYNAQGKVPSLPSGTVLDLTDPAPVQPPAPTQAELDRAAFYSAFRTVSFWRSLSDLGRTDVQSQLAAAVAAFNALPVDPSYAGTMVL